MAGDGGVNRVLSASGKCLIRDTVVLHVMSFVHSLGSSDLSAAPQACPYKGRAAPQQPAAQGGKRVSDQSQQPHMLV